MIAVTTTLVAAPVGAFSSVPSPNPPQGRVGRGVARCGSDPIAAVVVAAAKARKEGHRARGEGFVDEVDPSAASSGDSRHDNSEVSSRAPSSSSSELAASPDELQRRARQLREEADRLRSRIELDKQHHIQKSMDKVDMWLEHVLVQSRVNDDTELLNTVERAQQLLVEGRYSPDQVDQMFDRLCQVSHVSGRDSLDRNERLRLLVEAAGKVDELEPELNDNKRWTSTGRRVEHDLHKRLFAREWNVDLSDVAKDEIGGWDRPNHHGRNARTRWRKPR